MDAHQFGTRSFWDQKSIKYFMVSMKLVVSTVNKLLEDSLKKGCKIQAKMEVKIERIIRKKAMDCTSNSRTMINHSIAGLIWRI